MQYEMCRLNDTKRSETKKKGITFSELRKTGF